MGMGMGASNKPSTLEVTVLSAEGLRVGGNSANVFVVVLASSIASSHTTAMSTGGGGFHSWNEKFLVDLGTHTSSVSFEVKCKTRSGSVRDIAVARIPVADFLGGLVPDAFLQFLSYRMTDHYGRRNGIINFSVRAVTPDGKSVGGGYCGMPAAADKVGGGSSALPAYADQNSGGGVVMGIPVSWKNNGNNV